MYWFLKCECTDQVVKVYEVRLTRLSFKSLDFQVKPKFDIQVSALL